MSDANDVCVLTGSIAAGILPVQVLDLWSQNEMRTWGKSLTVFAIILLAVVALACNYSAVAVTPAIPLPTLVLPTSSPIAVPSPSAGVPTPSPISTLHPAVPATHTSPPLPSPTPTSVIPSACPLPGNPDPPDRPASFQDYPGVLASYLSAGGSAHKLERLLQDWGAITGDGGDVRSLDMTGDQDAEVVVALIDPASASDMPWPPGDVLIFKCHGGQVLPVYQGRVATEEESGDIQVKLDRVDDVNGTGRSDLVYVTRSCGAHTCWDRLYIIEWDGVGFVNRVPDMTEHPYAAFIVRDGQILVDVGGIGSAGAGYQRSYQETWAWDGRQFSTVEQLVGPPTALVHHIHDGDEALSGSDYGKAIVHYQAVLDAEGLPSGLFLENEELGVATVRAYARFKRMVAYAASGDRQSAQSQFELLTTEHPEGTPGYPFALLGQAFWSEFLAGAAPRSACAATVTLIEGDPSLVERLYAGYANPAYQPADTCRLTR